FICEGNTCADALAAPTWTPPVPDLVHQEFLSSQFFHQGTRVLVRQFKISFADAKSITAACPECQRLGPGLVFPHGVNPRGCQALDLWQTDITHIPSFGHLQYVHVSVDTFSKVVWALAH
ncbi:POK7 protein, partial [Nyctibius grandis]|nr:POK7 protein [Nyctibius grandis]